MRKSFLMVFLVTLFFSCGNKDNAVDNSSEQSSPKIEVEATEEEAPVSDDPMQNKGIGPVKSVELAAEVDQSLADKGKEIYESKCTSCHKPTEKFIGPAPKDILERRTPEWVMNMILNPEEMIQKDPIAIELLAEANGAPMANQGLSEEEARSVLEYFRSIE